ncbi:MAG: hypothetical protein IJ017_03400 [Oscillospiraceae bacterium]|nr:hypothetical protein [Oscillospiraceae bacterium]
MAKSVFGKILSVAAGVTAVVGAAAAASVAYGLKKWSKDEDSNDIKITTGGKYGLHIQKTEDGKYVVDTKYDWASDPDFCDCEDCCEDDDVVIDISDDCCCEAECECGCEDIEVEIVEESAEECCCGCEEEKTEE